MKPRAICTAVIVPGAVTARVDRVIRATREARDLIAEAEWIRKKRAPANPGRNGQCDPHGNSARRPFRVIGVSIYVDELNALDALVARARRNGKRHMTRSRMIREAVKAIAGEAP